MVVSPARSARVGPRAPRVARGVGLGNLYSPGSMASALWRQTGLTAPLSKFAVPDDAALGIWIEAAHGGRVTAELTGVLVPVIDADVRSAYPASWCLARWWTVLRAESLVETDVVAEVRALCRRAAEGDLDVVLGRENYPFFGRTICAVRPAGEPWPTERPGPSGSRLVVAPATGDVLHVSGPDAVAASYLSRRIPEVIWAHRLDPLGVEESAPLRLRDDVVVPAGADPLGVLVRMRPAKGGDPRMRSVIRVIANAAAWGCFAQLNPDHDGTTHSETPAAWTWPPVAAGVPALPRLWLAAIERAVTDRGGAIVAMDTDGMAIVALPSGGTVQLRDGRSVHALSWAEVDEIFSGFDVLDPFGDGGAFWSIERAGKERPLHLLSIAPKRYVKAQETKDGWVVIESTEHALGGGLADPPGLKGRDPERRRHWVAPVARHALDRVVTADVPGFVAPWDRDPEPFPALARWSAGSPRALGNVSAVLGAHAFAPLLEARVDRLLAPSVRAPIALDPGDDLSGWSALRWVGPDGVACAVSTGDDPGIAVPLVRLADAASDWCNPVPAHEPELLHFDRRLVRRVGRAGALVDARLADPEASAEEHQVLYTQGDAVGAVIELARSMGKRPFARRFGIPLKTAERLARGAKPSQATVARVLTRLAQETTGPSCALSGCDAPVPRPNARYCSKAHADRAYRAGRRARIEAAQ